ncbi:hypothetical protein GGX14DRAFT_700214, partial [Mycena pura]
MRDKAAASGVGTEVCLTDHPAAGCSADLTPSSPPLRKSSPPPAPYAVMDSASDKGSPRRSRSFENSGPVFESPCGRRGCTHVFTYSGTNPFVDLAAMVAAHRRHCVRRCEVSTSHRCAMAGWQPPASLVQQFAASKSTRRDAGHDYWTTSFKDSRYVDDTDYEESRTDEGWGSSADDDVQDDMTADGSTSRPFDSRGTCAENQLAPGHSTLSFSGQQVAISAGATMPGDTDPQRPLLDPPRPSLVQQFTSEYRDTERHCTPSFGDRRLDEDSDEPRTDERSLIDEGCGDAQENAAADGGTSGLDS